MRKTFSRRGFTLPEVLVTVTIVAVLAAVMVPAVINQVAKGDLPAVSGDLGSIRTAITTFAADTRHFPLALNDLSTQTLPTTDNDITGTTTYGLDAVNYRGPYLAMGPGPHTLPTGGVLADTFKLSGSLICLRDDTTSNLVPALISKVPLSVAKLIDRAIDGAESNTLGVVTYGVTGTLVNPGTLLACITTK